VPIGWAIIIIIKRGRLEKKKVHIYVRDEETFGADFEVTLFAGA
jgi:hypothetical protein